MFSLHINQVGGNYSDLENANIGPGLVVGIYYRYYGKHV